ncbi:hypothetical protein Leryth_013464 [Lithospermum erythrorhizon]|nr:hypothetical protein Leryth_013464 [Lithospermum erythrorhizon]
MKMCNWNMDMPSTNTILSAAASLTASLILFKSIANDIVPASLLNYLSKLSDRLSSQLTIIIEESDGLTPNQMFQAANVYLATKISDSTRRIKVLKPLKNQHLTVSVDNNQQITDSHDGLNLYWVLQTSSVSFKQTSKLDGISHSELRFFELSFHKKYRDRVLKEYLPHILVKAKEIKDEIKSVKLHTVDYNGKDYWGSVSLNHPATFETMAMDSQPKVGLIQDLDRFINMKDYYKRVGKAWKRGYLFYGPPGTGKSSLVAAMANYLKFDVYDLDLREVQCNSDLRRLLIGTANRSILVIEDIDCNGGVINRECGLDGTTENDKISLSGLLNFIDGLWSSCGDERIIVFTTNHKERLDPALLRPGRMDMHIHMSYCTFNAFKLLASNYLQLDDHSLFANIQQLLSKVQATPAEIAGELMKNDDADAALTNLVKLLQSKHKTDSVSN